MTCLARMRPGMRACLSFVLFAHLLATPVAHAQTRDRASDRGPGQPTSMFATYIQSGELLIYPFFEYYRDEDVEYSPNEFGYALDVDFRGRSRAYEGLIFVGYGISDRLAVEAEAAVIRHWLEKSPSDPSAMPARIEESGLGDVEGQLRWRWSRETEGQPEIFSYFETVLPLQKDRVLIGTADWELKLGTGIVRGFGWGTLTARVAAEYDAAEESVALGEYAVEYLKRVSPSLLLYAGVEGSQDELSLVPVVRWFVRPDVSVHLNSAVGVTSKATDWAPEVGVLFGWR